MPETLDALWSSLAPSEVGLVAAIVVHAADDRVLMLGYMNREALAATIQTRRVTFFSRSKQRLWKKGESSGHILALESMRVDCDGDALLVRATPHGPTCHTLAESCFFKPVVLPTQGALAPVTFGPEDDGPPPSAFFELWKTVVARREGRGVTSETGESYVRRLLDGGLPRINAKIREEAEELCVALETETDPQVAGETADLLFHVLVGLAARGVDPSAVAAVIRARHGVSGIDEKQARPSG